MSNEIGIYYCSKDSDIWYDVTNYINPDNLPQWTEKVNTQFVEFNIKLDAPRDQLPNETEFNYIYIKNGDKIAISKTKDRVELLDKSLSGIVKRSINRILDYGTNETNLKVSFNTTIAQKNFSYGVFEVDFKTVKPLSEILDHCFNFSIGLGGTMSNGTIIPRFYLPTELDIDIPPFSHKTDQLINVLNTLTKSVNYGYRLETEIEPDSDYTIKTYHTVVFYEKFTYGYNSMFSDWSQGLTREILKSGFMINPNYDPIHSPSEDVLIPTESEFEHEVDSDSMMNLLKILAFVIDSNGSLTRKDFKQTYDINQFSVGKAVDILYVARPVIATITNVSSTTQFDIDDDSASSIQFDADRMTDNALGGQLVAKIIINSIEYHRVFTISGNTITLTKGTLKYPSTNGSISDLSDFMGLTETEIQEFDSTLEFELINGFDVLRENRTTYPQDSTGYVVKHVKPTEDCYFKFTDVDLPNNNEENPVSCYYYSTDDFSEYKQWIDSILIHGQYYDTLEPNYNITKDEIKTLLKEEEKRTKPLETIRITSYRRNTPIVGSKINCYLPPLIDDTFYINSVRNTFITWKYSKKVYPLIRKEIEMVNYLADNLSYILAKSKLRSELSEALLETNITDEINLSLVYSIETEFNVLELATYVYPPTVSDATSITTSGFIANFANGGDSPDNLIFVLLDSSNNVMLGYAGIVLSGSATSYTVTGLSDDTLYKYKLQAYKGGNYSEYSSIKNVTTEALAKNWDYVGLTKGFYFNNENEDLTDKTGNETGTLINATIGSILFFGYKNYSFNGSNAYILATSSTSGFDEICTKLKMEIQFNFDIDLSSGQEMCLMSREVYLGNGKGEFRALIKNDSGTMRFYIHIYNDDYSPNFYIEFTQNIAFVKNTDYSLIFSVDFTNKYKTLVVNSTDYSTSLTATGFKSFATFDQFKINRNNPTRTTTAIGTTQYTLGSWFSGKIWRPLLSLNKYISGSDALIENTKFGF